MPCGDVSSTDVDPLLEPFIRATDSLEAEHHLGSIMSAHADPVIGKVVRGNLYGRQHKQELEDICSEARVHVVEWLQQLRADPGKEIDSFADYVAVVAGHTCDGYLRRTYRKRSQLKNRIRYLLEKHQSFALWEGKGEMLAGFAVWQGTDRLEPTDRKLQHLLNAPEEWPFADKAEHSDAVALIAALFRHFDGPIVFNRLVEVVATVWRVRDELPAKASSARETDEDPIERVRDRQPDVSTVVSYRIYLQRLWKEIRELPLRQRAALLMNFRDARGGSIIELLPLCGIATIREIAAVLETDTLNFATLWNSLPLDDLAISQQLGIGRQQVINLRKCARDRLARRMKETPW